MERDLLFWSSGASRVCPLGILLVVLIWRCSGVVSSQLPGVLVLKPLVKGLVLAKARHCLYLAQGHLVEATK